MIIGMYTTSFFPPVANVRTRVFPPIAETAETAMLTCKKGTPSILKSGFYGISMGNYLVI